jgi:hypothetical protein
MTKMGRPEKLPDLMSSIRTCIEEGRYLDTRHSLERQTERLITRPEILYVLKNGHHEKKKDQFDESHRAWNYAVRGRTLDRREVRVVVSFDENGMLIITAIGLEK